jgi:hypothetical protein
MLQQSVSPDRVLRSHFSIDTNFQGPANLPLARLKPGRMSEWLELGHTLSLFRLWLRAATIHLAVPLVVVFFTKAFSANAQLVTLLPPFVGTHSETWESFGVRQIPSGSPIFGGFARISGDHMVTATSFQLCTVFARPSDGHIFMDSDRPTGPLTISFSQPISAFGAYWGSGVNCPDCCGYGDAANILTFRDAGGHVIGTDSFFYQGNGALMWRGYRFAIPVKTITRTAGDNQEGVAIDGLQAIVGASSSYLGNISTRGLVQSGNEVMIGGFIVQGTQPDLVVVRAIGPELIPFGIPDALADPTLELHNGAGALIASNNNWQTTIIGGIITSSQVSAIENSGHAPTQPTEPAIIARLPPGNYTAIVRGVNNTVGVALVEVYDLSPGTTSTLTNISTRDFVQTGENVMIGGFIVQGTGSKKVIVRAIGPELTGHGITNALRDPLLELHNEAGALIASNNNWQTTIVGGIITANQASDIQNSGHAPTAPSESAIIANLQPGNYTAIVRGVNHTTGIALVEVYDLQ